MTRRTIITYVCLPLFLYGESYEDLFRQASDFGAQGDYVAAIAKYDAALKLRPGAPEALSNLGVMQHLAGRFSEAVSTMSQVARMKPDLLPARLVLGLDLVRLDRSSEAIPHLKSALDLSPDNQEAAIGLAAAYVGTNQLVEAAKIYEAEIRVRPAAVEAWYGLGVCYERMAETASKRLSTLPGGAVLDRQFLSEFLLARGESRLAEEALREAAAIDIGQPSEEAKQVFEEARRLASRSRGAFLKLVEIAPDAWQSRLFLADIQRQQRLFPEAIAGYQLVERMLPDAPAPKLGLATVYWELGQLDNAETYLERVLVLKPNSSQALFELGNIRLRQHREKEAVPLLEAYLKTEPGSLSACQDLGRAYYHLGDDAQAALYLDRARPIDQKGDVHFQLATVLRRLGRIEEAERAMRQSKLLRERELERQQRLRGNVK